jgi:hypothetical protein
MFNLFEAKNVDVLDDSCEECQSAIIDVQFKVSPSCRLDALVENESIKYLCKSPGTALCIRIIPVH